VATVLGTRIGENAETINILLLGISEDLNSKLTDTIMVCSYNPKTQKASVLSIPRDTFIGKNINQAKANDKINTVYSRSGIDKCISEVESITGQTIPYYAVVNTDALIKIVDIIGGVDFEVPIDMDYDDSTQNLHIHLTAGMQTITGEKAEQLLRFRHNNNGTSYPESYGDNDYGRMRTQREFIKETIKQTLQLKNITKAKKIANAILENIETNLTSDIIKEYISYAVDFDSSNILMNQLPGESIKPNEVWVYDYSVSQTKTTMEEIESYLNQTESAAE
jgi:LCP family protein required for cell wall assembly